MISLVYLLSSCINQVCVRVCVFCFFLFLCEILYLICLFFQHIIIIIIIIIIMMIFKNEKTT
jgi:hypothetical protein